MIKITPSFVFKTICNLMTVLLIIINGVLNDRNSLKIFKPIQVLK